MKKNINNNYELLSAYLDGEVSSEQIKEIENKLSESSLLRDKLAELKRLKEITNSSYSPPPESHYFETVLNQKINEERKFRRRLKSFMPAYGLFALAIIVILLLKIEPIVFDNSIHNRDARYAGTYNNNLKPLLFAANLSNEDIFNFAFYKMLPLDNKNKQYLQLGTDKEGKEYFEIKKDPLQIQKNNLEKFTLALGLNEEQKLEVDSIIKVYADELQEQILVNDKNTLAVSQNLFDYNRALAAELLTFAAKANKSSFRKIMPAGLTIVENKSTPIVIKEIKSKSSSPTHNFVFFNNDSIFTKPYTVDKEKIKNEIKFYNANRNSQVNEFINYEVNVNLDSNLAKIKKYKYFNDSLFVLFDSNSFNIKVHVLPKVDIDFPNMDSIFIELDKARENFNEFSFHFQKNLPKIKGNIKFKYSDSLHNYLYDIEKIEVDSILENTFKQLDSLKIKNNFNFQFNNDSLDILIKKLPELYKNNEWFDNKNEVKKLKKEIEELKKEMKEMKKKLNEKPQKIKT